MASNFGQMLAAAQAYATPEQERMQAQSQAQGAEFEVQKEKKSQMEELQALMEAEMQKASDKKGMFGGHLGNIGKLLSFIPGVGTGIGAGMQALEGMGQAGAQKKALKGLMKDPRFAKFKGSWLGDPTKSFMKDIKGLAGDIDPLKTGLSSLATSMVTGDLAKGIGGKFKDAFTPTTELGKSALEGVTAGTGMGGTSVTDILKDINKGGAAAPGLKGLFKDFDIMEILEGAGGEKGFENLQALPMLMQLFGGGGQEQESDASGYFN